MAALVALFCKQYPGLYLNPCWPTTDHIVPWGLFWVLYAEIRRLLALERLNLSRAVGQWHVSDDARRRDLNADQREAAPYLIK